MPRSPTSTTRDRPNRLVSVSHLIGDGLGVAGVAGIDLHGDGPPVGVGQDAVDDDRPAGLAVAVMAEAGQRAGLPLVVAAGDVVEHQRPRR